MTLGTLLPSSSLFYHSPKGLFSLVRLLLSGKFVKDDTFKLLNVSAMVEQHIKTLHTQERDVISLAFYSLP